MVFDDTGLLEFAGGFGDALTANTEHVRNQLLGHYQVIVLKAVQRQQQPAAELLVNRVVTIADGGL